MCFIEGYFDFITGMIKIDFSSFVYDGLLNDA